MLCSVSAVGASAACVPVSATPRSSSTTRRSRRAWIVGRTVVGNVARGATPSRRQRETDPLRQLLALRTLTASVRPTLGLSGSAPDVKVGGKSVGAFLLAAVLVLVLATPAHAPVFRSERDKAAGAVCKAAMYQAGWQNRRCLRHHQEPEQTGKAASSSCSRGRRRRSASANIRTDADHEYASELEGEPARNCVLADNILVP